MFTPQAYSVLCWKICTVIFWIALSLTIIASIFRFGFWTTLTTAQYRDTNKTDTTHLFHSRLVYLTVSFAELLHVLEITILVYGITNFYKYTKRRNTNLLKETIRVKDCCNGSSICTCCMLISLILAVATILLFLLVYSFATFVPPSLLMAWMNEIYLAFIHKEKLLIVAKLYAGMSWIRHFTSWTIRITMVIATLRIRGEWLQQQPAALPTHTTGLLEEEPETSPTHTRGLLEEEPKTSPTHTRVLLEEESAASPTSSKHTRVSSSEELIVEKDRFKELLTNYDNRGQFVAALQGVYEQWFTIQWIVHFIGIGLYCIIITKSLITEDYKSQGHQPWFILTHLVNDIAALVIPYLCGNAMNIYNKVYLDNLEKKQEELLNEITEPSLWFMQRAILIPERQSYRFIPSLCGITIPLESNGYTISLIVSLCTFVMSIMMSFARVN